MIKRNDKVLVGFSGNLSSTCLLSLIRYGDSLDTAKKIPFQYSILFIDGNFLHITLFLDLYLLFYIVCIYFLLFNTF